MHHEESFLAGTTVKLRDGLESLFDSSEYEFITLSEQDFKVIDWWDRIHGETWDSSEHPVAIDYAIRTLNNGAISDDNEVLYGKVGNKEVLVHVSEIEDL